MRKDLEEELIKVVGSIREDVIVLDALSMQYPDYEETITPCKLHLEATAVLIENELLRPPKTD